MLLCLFTCLFVFPTCSMLYAMFSYALFLFLLYVDIRVTCSHAYMILLAMPYLDLCVCVYFHAIWLDPCLHMLICLDSCSSMFMCQASTCLCACFYAYMSRSMFYMPMCLDLCSLHALYYLSCAYALHAMSMCLDLGYVCHAMCYCSPFVPFITFSCILAYWFKPDLDPMVFVIVHTPRPTLKGLDHSYLHVYACLLLCFMFVLASLVLGFAMFSALRWLDLMWLHPTPMRPCSDVTIWEASPDARLLRAYPSLFQSVRCYASHACLCHPLDFYASLHACLYVHA